MKYGKYTLQEICAMSSQNASRLLDSRRRFGTDVFRPQVPKAFGRQGGRCRGSALPDCGWLLGHQLERQESGLFLFNIYMIYM